MLFDSSWLLPSLLTIVTFAFYKYTTRHFDYWKQRGVYYEKPLPVFGNTLDVFLFRCTLAEWLKNLCMTLNERYFGLFVFDKPSLVITDPDLLQYIFIRDFNVFKNRSVASGEHDYIIRELMFFQKYPNWRVTRPPISQFFSLGRLKQMFPTIKEIGVEFQDFVDCHLGDIDDVKEIVSRWSLEVISRTAFGVKANSFVEKNPEFLQYSEKLFANNLKNSFSQLCYFFKKEWVESLRLMFFPKDALIYFRNVFLQAMESRKQSGIKANDLIDIVIETRRNGKLDIDDSLLATGALTIFVGALETTGAAISFLIYELARNPDVQTKLRREIEEVTRNHGGLTFDAISDMKYLNMCFNEILRMYITLPFLDRLCEEDYELPGTNLVIEKGMNVYIPINAIHFNENFYPEPYKFNPDRFEEGTESYRNSMKFLAFGAGPRICIGERFGVLASKICICSFLQKFKVVSNVKTPQKIKFSVKTQLCVAENGLPMRIEKYVPDNDGLECK